MRLHPDRCVSQLMELHRVVTTPGLLAPARTFSLVRDETGIYVICTGRAMGYVASGGGVAGVVADKILDKVADKRAVEIEQNEQRIRATTPANAVKELAHSRFLPAGSIRKIDLREPAGPTGWPVAVIHADKKLKLHFHAHDPAAVREFFAPFRRS